MNEVKKAHAKQNRPSQVTCVRLWLNPKLELPGTWLCPSLCLGPPWGHSMGRLCVHMAGSLNEQLQDSAGRNRQQGGKTGGWKPPLSPGQVETWVESQNSVAEGAREP
jgi:hypothetical protein